MIVIFIFKIPLIKKLKFFTNFKTNFNMHFKISKISKA